MSLFLRPTAGEFATAVDWDRGERTLRFLIESASVQNLTGPAAVAVDGDPFAAQAIRQQVGVGHVFSRGFMREVDRFRNGIIGVFLKRGLDPDVVFGRKIVGGLEHARGFFGGLWK